VDYNGNNRLFVKERERLGQLTFEQVQLNQMNLHVLSTPKFKTTTIVFQLEQELNEDLVTKTALIPFVLKRGCEKYPTTQALRRYMDQLFGAVFLTDVGKKGEKQIIQVYLEIANEKYLSDKSPLLQKGIEFLGDVIARPLLEGNGFSKQYVKSEADLLKKKIESLVDDKIRYANQRVTEEMCKNEPYRLLAYGQIEDFAKITSEELYTYYQKLLNENPIDIYIVGDVSVEEVKSEVEKQFNFQRTSVKELPFAPTEAKHVQEELIIDRMEIGQGKLNIGCRTHLTLEDEDYEKLLVYNGVLGGFPHSKLFVNVREKASLAYYAVSRLESHKGILMLMSGIEIQNFDKAVEIMKEQLNLMKKGDISDKELSQTKAMLINQLNETLDNARTMIDFSYNSRLSGRSTSLEEMIAKINAVTIEDITGIAKKIEIDTIYFLRDKEGAADGTKAL
jgi:predicted Zn-dependent peptidase